MKKDENRKIRVAFFGSSEFSIPTFKCLLQEKDIDVVSVVTMPAACKNRGKKLSNNIVYDYAVQNDISLKSIFTPNSLKKNNEIIDILKQQNLDFIIVVAYGKIIPDEIIKLPKFNILNLHPSALPKYRGAAPIERAIENGEKEIDICIMKIDNGLDTGDIAVREKYVLDINKGANEIVPEVAMIGGRLMVKTIKMCVDNEVFFVKQEDDCVSYAKKIDKEELFIDLEDNSLDAEKVFNKIRAFNNSGCCYYVHNSQRVKIISCELMKTKNLICGFERKTGFLLFKNGTIKPIFVQKEGKKPMTLKDYLNGLK